MTSASRVAVVTTQLARTDRRALSQAWYSALHLDRDDEVPRVAARATAPPPFAAPRRAHGAAPSAAAPTPNAERTTAVRGGETSSRPAIERRAPVERAARRVERVLDRLVRTPPPRPAQTLALGGGRVTLLVRRDAGATRFVALCSEPLRATVERALAHARFVLAAQGRTLAS